MRKSTHAAAWLASRSSGTARSAPNHRGTVGKGWPTSSGDGQASRRPASSRPTARYDTADEGRRRRRAWVGPEGGEEVSVEVGPAGRDGVHHDQSAPAPEVAGALGRERLPRPRPILVPRADQLDRGRQPRVAVVGVHLHPHVVGRRPLDGDGQTRRGPGPRVARRPGPPTGRTPARWRRRPRTGRRGRGTARRSSPAGRTPALSSRAMAAAQAPWKARQGWVRLSGGWKWSSRGMAGSGRRDGLHSSRRRPIRDRPGAAASRP